MFLFFLLDLLTPTSKRPITQGSENQGSNMVSSSWLPDQRGPPEGKQDEAEAVETNDNPLSCGWFSDFILLA